MILLTGDIHANFQDMIISNTEYSNLASEDYLIVLGDFGVWTESEEQQYYFDQMSKLKFTILFIPGNHENYDLLDNLPTEIWHEAKVSYIRPNIIYIHRGEIFTLEGKSFLALGGASSHDIRDGILEPDDPHLAEKILFLRSNYRTMFRINHRSWWKQELPTQEELDYTTRNLLSYNNKVDYILTHAPSHRTLYLMWHKGQINFTPSDKGDILTEYLTTLEDKIDFKHWYFGHLHYDTQVDPKHTCLYKTTVPLNQLKEN